MQLNSVLFNRVIEEGKTAECSNYRLIRLLFHTMKIPKRIFDNRFHDFVQITTAIDTIVVAHAMRSIALYIAFLDLGKVFDREPHELIWYALKQHLLLEEPVR